MKNYFNESDNLQQLCLTEIQWKLCIDKFSNKNDASKYAAMLNRKYAQAAARRNKEAQLNEWQTRRLTLQRRLVAKTCNRCGARYKRSHVKCLTSIEQMLTRNCSNASCCSRCSINDVKCMNCILHDAAEAAAEAEFNHHNNNSSSAGENATSFSNSTSRMVN
jgi:hypothetical protein